jgi:hypothetical protein
MLVILRTLKTIKEPPQKILLNKSRKESGERKVVQLLRIAKVLRVRKPAKSKLIPKSPRIGSSIEKTIRIKRALTRIKVARDKAVKKTYETILSSLISTN